MNKKEDLKIKNIILKAEFDKLNNKLNDLNEKINHLDLSIAHNWKQLKQFTRKKNNLNRAIIYLKAKLMKNNYLIRFYELFDPEIKINHAYAYYQFIKYLENEANEQMIPYRSDYLLKISNFYKQIAWKEYCLNYTKHFYPKKNKKINKLNEQINGLNNKINTLIETFNQRYHAKYVARLEKTKKLTRKIEKIDNKLSGDNIIELKNVCKYYNNGFLAVKVLDQVNLTIKRGEFVVILGPSGSGKTTLLNIISGMDNATYGDVIIANENLIDYNQNQLTKFRRDHIGYVFQQYALLPNLNVKENILIGQNLQSDKKLRIDIDQILESIGMKQYMKKYPNELSGGQQQRVSIARSIAKNPNILFGDEPTGAIDEAMSKEIMRLFLEVNKKYKTTIVIVTHNPILAQIANTVIHVGNGTIQKIVTNKNPKSVDEITWGTPE